MSENYDVQNLIPMAKKYIGNANVDKNNNGNIDSGEVGKLLAGTLASSVEDLSYNNIYQKILENDTEKIFTAFMTNQDILGNTVNSENFFTNAKNKVGSKYDLLIQATDDISQNLSNIQNDIASITGIFEKARSNGSDMPSSNDLNQVSQKIVNVRSEIMAIKNTIKNHYNSPASQQQLKTLDDMCDTLLAQFDRTQKQAGSEWPRAHCNEYLEQVHSIEEQISSAVTDLGTLNSQYKEQKMLDVDMIDKLSKSRDEFIEDGVSSTDEQEQSKQLLKELIEQASPFARKSVLSAIEKASGKDDENYPTHTEPTPLPDDATNIQNTTESKIKRSSFKTPNEIYKLNGKKVIVYNLAGQVLRTEPFDPSNSNHKRFLD